MDPGLCPHCGRPLDSHNRHVRFGLPDPVLPLPADERAELTWQTGDLMQVRGYGSFVRALLPVRLTGGYSVTFGVWLGVGQEEFNRAVEIWWAPQYPTLEVDGVLANKLPVWGLLDAPVHAQVRREGDLPYVVSSPDPQAARVLNSEWDHEPVLSAIPQ